MGKSPNAGQDDLSAVSVPGEHCRDVELRRLIQPSRIVRQKDCRIVRSLQHASLEIVATDG